MEKKKKTIGDFNFKMFFKILTFMKLQISNKIIPSALRCTAFYLTTKLAGLIWKYRNLKQW